MPLDLSTPLGILLAITPEVVLSLCALVVLLVVAWRHDGAADSRLAGWLALGGIAVTGVAEIWLWRSGAANSGGPGMVTLDAWRYLASLLILFAAAAAILLSIDYLEREEMTAPEYYPLVLFATIGMLFMVAAQDLIVIFLGLETMSVSVYVLAGYDRRDPASGEAGLKYFLVGAFASAFLLYGIALLYGSTGTTNLALAGAQLAGGALPLAAGAGLALLLIGFAFKVAAVPFHMWAPDVYDGAPTPVTAYMVTAVKATAFVTMARILVVAFPDAGDVWRPALATLAILTMILGNFVALAQKSLKRMLAYSSVAHAGYLLVALLTGTPLGLAALLVYLLGYALTTLAAFGLLAALGRNGERDLTLDDIAGLGEGRPMLAFALSVCMLSLLGFPGTLGFIGKWFILLAAITQGQNALAVVLVLTSVVSAGFYLPVVMAMYMRPARAPLVHRDHQVRLPARLVLIGTVAAVLALGIWPGGVLRSMATGARSALSTLGPGGPAH
jgi:NADH-quinone oxidoreductase subunit N